MFLEITLIILAVAIMVLLYHMAVVKTIWEKLISLNLIAIKVVMLITVFGVMIGSPAVLDVSITYGIIGFISVTMISRHLLRGGRLK